MDTIVLAFFVNSALIGIYEVAWNLASILVLVSVSIKSTLFPEMSDLGTDQAYETIHHYLNEGLVFVGVFAIPGLFGAAVIGPRLLKIYRPEFQQGATILLILIIARLAATYGSQLLNTINAVDRPDIAFRINLLFVILNLVLNVSLIALMGWYGAAIATTVSATVILGLGYVALTRIIGRPRIPYDEIGREVVAGGVMAIVLFGLNRVVPSGHYLTIGLIVLGGVLYIGLLLAISSRIRGKAWSLVPATVIRWNR